MFPDRSACCITISQEIWPKQSCLNCGSSFLSPAIYKARSASIDHPPSSQTKVLPRLCAFTHFRFKEKLQPANCIMMNNRVTLPPISDIFTNKNVGALPQQQPQFAIQRPLVTGPAPPAYAAMPVYLYQYMYNSPPTLPSFALWQRFIYPIRGSSSVRKREPKRSLWVFVFAQGPDEQRAPPAGCAAHVTRAAFVKVADARNKQFGYKSQNEKQLAQGNYVYFVEVAQRPLEPPIPQFV